MFVPIEINSLHLVRRFLKILLCCRNKIFEMKKSYPSPQTAGMIKSDISKVTYTSAK